jgi:hypothetical protein
VSVQKLGQLLPFIAVFTERSAWDSGIVWADLKAMTACSLQSFVDDAEWVIEARLMQGDAGILHCRWLSSRRGLHTNIGRCCHFQSQ